MLSQIAVQNIAHLGDPTKRYFVPKAPANTNACGRHGRSLEHRSSFRSSGLLRQQVHPHTVRVRALIVPDVTCIRIFVHEEHSLVFVVLDVVRRIFYVHPYSFC